jgi:hypothetical protein
MALRSGAAGAGALTCAFMLDLLRQQLFWR